ncbi:hypothetical protein ABL78_1092 [Leptomonas seymouri]|uniref:Uncharacterized protein n=1 Tax=Leptomonas seymouri TaxID=5684 RepID=A0A0N0P8D5_LEPSE|nr:hypothetical protein ABL78_1092 [Leptomonas seymouri]|eukprot:KPI89829.1 hypothetical protein ABL78_1092 [Leptomonas seymouri]
MEQSGSAAEESTDIAIKFVRDDALVPEPKVEAPTTDRHRRAPRNPGSRRINFIDDGKLFEGHFTVQSTNLKSIIQYLLDRHNEQDVIIQDLQKQVHMLRSRSVQSRKRCSVMEMGGAASGANRPVAGNEGASSDIGKRLKRVEHFIQLWGVQLKDVSELVEEYGDPSITPDAYTSYLLDLPVFRLTRREARALMLSASQPTAASANTAAASDTISRRRSSSNRRDLLTPPSTASTSPSQGERPKAEMPRAEMPKAEMPRVEAHIRRNKEASDTDSLAEATLEKATAALERAETLLAELRRTSPRLPPTAAPPKPRRAAAPSKAPAAGNSTVAVDVEARADIEELGDYVMQRFEELETRTAMMIAHSVSSSASHHERNASRQAGEAAREGEGTSKRSPQLSPVPSPHPHANTIAAPSPGGAEEVVDAIAREDAAASLDLLEELETAMERRFKELNSAIANLAARTAAFGKMGSGGSGDTERSQSRNTSPGLPAKNAAQISADGGRRMKDQTSTAEESTDSGESRISMASSRNAALLSKRSNNALNRKASPSASDAIPLTPGLPPALPTNLVDQTARDETYALSDRVSELEEELLERWQAMEERLRIIGRAAMKQGITNTVGNGAGVQSLGRAPTVDRKAREDASLSLMRLQLVEKELAQLKRRLAAIPVDANSVGQRAALDDVTSQAPLPLVIEPVGPLAPLRDTYGSKVAGLEREVEQRMAEVNLAIAQLRGVDSATPVALSSKKGEAEETAVPAVLPPLATAEVSYIAGQLVLRAGDGDATTTEPTTKSPAPPSGSADHRRVVLQSMAQLNADVDGDKSLFPEFARTSVRVGERRTTVSRLRSPDVPPFGSHLVQREVIDIPLLSLPKVTGDDTAEGTAAQREATAATPLQAARRVSNIYSGFSHAEGQVHSNSPQKSRVRTSSVAHVGIS